MHHEWVAGYKVVILNFLLGNVFGCYDSAIIIP